MRVETRTGPRRPGASGTATALLALLAGWAACGAAPAPTVSHGARAPATYRITVVPGPDGTSRGHRDRAGARRSLALGRDAGGPLAAARDGGGGLGRGAGVGPWTGRSLGAHLARTPPHRLGVVGGARDRL